MTTYLERELGTGGDLLTAATARAAALARAARLCRGICVPVRVRRRPDGVVAFDVPVARGASLAEIAQDRGLSVGACVTVGVGVARALAAMHGERVAHGDVSAANVVASGADVMLVDTMGALAGERGTQGFAAPERASGASPAGDVFALGMLLRAIADERALPVIEAWTAPLLSQDPSARPTASHAARALERCSPPEPLPVLSAPVAAAMRSGALPRTVATRQDRWWRAERSALRLAPVAVLAAGAVISGWGPVPATAANPGPIASSAAIPVSSLTLGGPADAAVDLTERQVDAFAKGDVSALSRLVRVGSEASRSLPTELEPLDGLRLVKATSAVTDTGPGQATVEVTSELSGYSVGQEQVPPGTATAVLVLRLTPRGWLVERILPAP